jgi:hypothetical protein
MRFSMKIRPRRAEEKCPAPTLRIRLSLLLLRGGGPVRIYGWEILKMKVRAAGRSWIRSAVWGPHFSQRTRNRARLVSQLMSLHRRKMWPPALPTSQYRPPVRWIGSLKGCTAGPVAVQVSCE